MKAKNQQTRGLIPMDPINALFSNLDTLLDNSIIHVFSIIMILLTIVSLKSQWLSKLGYCDMRWEIINKEHQSESETRRQRRRDYLQLEDKIDN